MDIQEGKDAIYQNARNLVRTYREAIMPELGKNPTERNYERFLGAVGRIRDRYNQSMDLAGQSHIFSENREFIVAYLSAVQSITSLTDPRTVNAEPKTLETSLDKIQTRLTTLKASLRNHKNPRQD